MNEDLCLYQVEVRVEEGDGVVGNDVSFVAATSLSNALEIWKTHVALTINEDLSSDGVDRIVKPEELEDPDTIILIGEPQQLMI